MIDADVLLSCVVAVDKERERETAMHTWEYKSTVKIFVKRIARTIKLTFPASSEIPRSSQLNSGF